MGSLPFVLNTILPRSGAVPPNALIVLEGHVFSPLAVTAHAAGVDIPVALENAPEFGPRRNGTLSTWLVRPTTSEWPAGSTVVLTATREPQEPLELHVPIALERDVTPPRFSSMSQPERRTLRGPREPDREVVVVAHRGFTDDESPLLLVTLEVGGTTLTGSAREGMAGALPLPPGVTSAPNAIALTDLAGNAVRIPSPCTGEPLLDTGPALLPLTCVAGTLVPDGDGFVATTDAGIENGFSRGHFRARDISSGDIDISVTAARLTDDHAMPIEVAFRGGFFGVTGTSQFHLYESDSHWTGWKSTPVSVGAEPMTLRVVQRGAVVEGFVNGVLAGSFTLQNPVLEEPVGLFFKGPVGVSSRMRFQDFRVAPLLEQSAATEPASRSEAAAEEDLSPVHAEEQASGAVHTADIGPLVWGSHDEGVGEPHPDGAPNPSGAPWDFAVLCREANDTIVGRVWVATVDTRVVADFRFEDVLGGEVDEAVLPLLVDGFFGDDGHTLGHYRNYDRFDEVRFANLRTGSSWWVSWDAMDEMVEAMKMSPAYVARTMR